MQNTTTNKIKSVQGNVFAVRFGGERPVTDSHQKKPFWRINAENAVLRFPVLVPIKKERDFRDPIKKELEKKQQSGNRMERIRNGLNKINSLMGDLRELESQEKRQKEFTQELMEKFQGMGINAYMRERTLIGGPTHHYFELTVNINFESKFYAKCRNKKTKTRPGIPTESQLIGGNVRDLNNLFYRLFGLECQNPSVDASKRASKGLKTVQFNWGFPIDGDDYKTIQAKKASLESIANAVRDWNQDLRKLG